MTAAPNRSRHSPPALARPDVRLAEHTALPWLGGLFRPYDGDQTPAQQVMDKRFSAQWLHLSPAALFSTSDDRSGASETHCRTESSSHAVWKEQTDAQQGQEDKNTQAGGAQQVSGQAHRPGAFDILVESSQLQQGADRPQRRHACWLAAPAPPDPAVCSLQVWEDVRKEEGVHDGKVGPLGTTDRCAAASGSGGWQQPAPRRGP